MAQIATFGELEGQLVHSITLTGAGGLRLSVLSLGARLMQLWVPDRAGVLANIVLGHDTLSDYLTHAGYLGATCGRFANRIAGSEFWLNGVRRALEANEGRNQLHGGPSWL